MTRPILELRCGPAPSDELRLLVQHLGRRWCRVAARVTSPAARLATAWDPAQLRQTLRDDVPVAVWFDDPAALDPVADDLPRAAALVGPAPVARDVPGALVGPVESFDCSRWRPASPFARRRRRLLYGAPDDLVVDVGSLSSSNLPPDRIAILLGLAAAAVATGRWALPSLAMGTPLVTDARTAAWLGAVPDEHVVLGDGSSSEELAAALAADDRRSARLGWLGRCLVERSFDMARFSDSVAAALQLPDAHPGVGRARWELAQLRTPLGSLPSDRVAAVLSAFPSPTAEGVRSWTW